MDILWIASEAMCEWNCGTNLTGHSLISVRLFDYSRSINNIIEFKSLIIRNKFVRIWIRNKDWWCCL